MYKFLLITALFLFSCSTTSTLIKNDGQVLEGKITRISENTLSIKPNEDSPEILVKDSEVADIDHPGNVHIIVGSSLAAVGLLVTSFVLVIRRRESGTFADVNLIGSIPLLLVGTPMAIWGWSTYYQAEQNVVEILPNLIGENGFSPGLQVKLSF